MTALLYVVGVVAFILAILASIGLHELGHMIPAKAFGGKVTQYFIGFGPTVWSRRRGETEYGIKGIPLGGYVKIVGMLPPAPDDQVQPGVATDDERVERVRGTNTGLFTQLVSDARQAEWELVGPEDRDRLFYRMAWWKKVIVMAGGPTVNLLIAFVLFLGAFGIYGIQNPVIDKGAPVIDTVSRCVIPFTEEGRKCTAQDPPSPAYEAGLRPGDRIVSFNGTPVSSWDQMRGLIRGNADGQAVIRYERDGTLLTGRTSTTVEARPTSTSDQKLTQVGFLGVTPTYHLVTTRHGPLFTLEQMGTMTKDFGGALVTLPAKVWGVAKAIVGVEPRSRYSPVSIVGGGRIAGEAASNSAASGADRFWFLVTLVASFNLFIGLFNFIPLLPLDGGHIASALWEAVRRGIARLRRRPDPGFVDAAKLLPVAYVVAAVLLVMGVVLIVGDIVAPVQITQ